MKETINVLTGEVKTGKDCDILVSNAIGSCIVVASIDVVNNIGALAHIMLPGKAPSKEKQQKTKYAVDAIDCMLQLLQQQCVAPSDINVCLVGAGNVLKKENYTICNDNIKSVMKILNDKQLKISAKALGGTLRRSVRLDIENGRTLNYLPFFIT
jgi:chemotaxis protein CheD